MKEETINTIRYIGRWAIRIFLIALISTSIKSCAKAYTEKEQDAIDKLQILIDKGYLQDEFLTNFLKSSVINKVNNYRYCSILITSNSSSYLPNRLIMFLSNDTVVNRSTTPSNSWYNYWYQGTANVAPFDGVAPGNGNYELNRCTFLYGYSPCGINTRSLQLAANSEYGDNILIPPEHIYLEFVNSFDGKYYQNFLYYTYQGELYQQNKLKIGEIIQNDAYYAEVRLRRGKEENNVIIGTSFISFGNSVYNDGVLYYDNGDLYLNTININYGQPYRLEIQGYYGDGGDDLSEDIDWYLFLPVTATISGDSILSLGSGDFNIQDNASQIIQNQEESNNWWKQTINDMFVVSGEEIQQIIDNTMQELKIESGEIQEATRVLNYLDAEPGDFIISWGNLTTHFSISGEQLEKQLVIPARQINFSEMERNSQELHEAMNWARIITNISIFSILMHQMYICFIATLGVPVYLYGQKQEEKAELAKQEEAKKQSQAKQEANWMSRLESQKYNEWLRNHRKR